MRTRLLSPDSLWIEAPLSPRACRLVWRAMAACGLCEGKINSFRDVHFSPLYSWQQHLVEGRTAPGFFRSHNARAQARLSAQDDGTRVDFDAVHLKSEIDFGAARVFERQLVLRMEAFLRDLPADWHETETATEAAPPIASPTDFEAHVKGSEPALEPLTPLRAPSLLSPRQRLQAWLRFGAVAVVFLLALWWNVPGLAFLVLAAWTLWNGRQVKKVDWFSFVLYSGLGLMQCWQLVQRWF